MKKYIKAAISENTTVSLDGEWIDNLDSDSAFDPIFNSNRYNEFLDKLDQQGYYTDRGNFVCDLHDKHVELWVPHGHATGEAIAYCLDEMGMPAPNGVDFLSGDLPEIYKQFIDDYCKFIINYCEKRIDIALTSYII